MFRQNLNRFWKRRFSDLDEQLGEVQFTHARRQNPKSENDYRVEIFRAPHHVTAPKIAAAAAVQSKDARIIRSCYTADALQIDIAITLKRSRLQKPLKQRGIDNINKENYR